MSKHNYSQYSNKKNNKVEPDKTKSKNKKSKSGAVTTGTVEKCVKLNVRSKPSIKADAIAVLNVNDKVKIDVDNSTDEWFKITTTDGVKGYCMRKFVNANI